MLSPQSATFRTLATFNVLSHNRDDHARQFTFLMSRDGGWRLAPAYDLTFAPGPGGEHSTSVLGRGKDIDRECLPALAGVADLRDAEAREAIDQVADAVADWDGFAASCDVGAASRNRVAKALASL